MKEEIFRIRSVEQFQDCCLKIFHFQYNYNPVYRQYVDLIGISQYDVTGIENIPFLPIRFFKTQKIITSADLAVEAEKVFTSSSTSGMIPSSHFVTDISIYEKDFLEGFRLFYGDPSQYAVLALLPSYLEREGSSLVYMVDRLIKESHCPQSGFYLYNYEDLYQTLLSLRKERRKTLLIGVTFALLDFAAHYKMEPASDWDFSVMETGGMKGRGEEIPREEIHRRLASALSVDNVHSEYGMCELLSQGYSKGGGIFFCPPWMKVLVRDFNAPFIYLPEGKRGGINIIDLANINSCSFLETEDVGRIFPEGSFAIEGRLSDAERRGCNMLIE